MAQEDETPDQATPTPALGPTSLCFYCIENSPANGQGKQGPQAISVGKSVTKGCVDPSIASSRDFHNYLWTKGDMGMGSKDGRWRHDEE